MLWAKNAKVQLIVVLSIGTGTGWLLGAEGNGAGRNAAPVVTPAGQPDGKDLREAPPTITVDGKVLTIRAQIFNNRMPSFGHREGTGIYFVINLATKDGTPMPDGLVFDTVCGIQGKNKWETRGFDELKINKPPMVRIIPRNAPGWTASSEIDVVVKLRDSAKKEHLIRAAGVGAREVH